MRVKYLFQPPVVTAVLFLIINTVLLVDTARYAASVRLFPLLLGVPVAVGFLVVLLAELVPGLREWVPGLERRDFLGTQRFRRPPLSPLRPPAGTNRGPTSESRRVRRFSSLIVVFFILIIVAGYMIAIPAFLLFFFRSEAKMSWASSLSFTAGIYLFVYILFIQVLHVPLFDAHML